MPSLAQTQIKNIHLYDEVYEVIDFKRIEKRLILGLSVGPKLGAITVEVGQPAHLGWFVSGMHKVDLRHCFHDFNEAKAALAEYAREHLATIERLQRPA